MLCDESVKNERPVDRIGPTVKEKEREKEREKKREEEKEKSVYHEQVDIYVRY